MDKIASPQDLTHELKALLAACEAPSPSRKKLASDLRSLASRVATEEDEYDLASSDLKVVRGKAKGVVVATRNGKKVRIPVELQLDRRDLKDFGQDVGIDFEKEQFEARFIFSTVYTSPGSTTVEISGEAELEIDALLKAKGLQPGRWPTTILFEGSARLPS